MQVDANLLKKVENEFTDFSAPSDLLTSFDDDGVYTEYPDLLKEVEKNKKEILKEKSSLEKSATSVYNKALKDVAAHEKDFQKVVDNPKISTLEKDYKKELVTLEKEYKDDLEQIQESTKDQISELEDELEEKIAQLQKEVDVKKKNLALEEKKELAELQKDFEQAKKEAAEAFHRSSEMEKENLQNEAKEELVVGLTDLVNSVVESYEGLGFPVTLGQIHQVSSIEDCKVSLEKQLKTVLHDLDNHIKAQIAEQDSELVDAKDTVKEQINDDMNELHQQIEVVVSHSEVSVVADWMQKKKKDVADSSSLEDVPSIASIKDAIHKLKPALEKLLASGSAADVKAAQKIWLDLYKKYVVLGNWLSYWTAVESGQHGDTHELKKGAIKTEASTIDDYVDSLV